MSLAPSGFDSVTDFSTADDEMGWILLWVLLGFGRGLKRKGLGLRRDKDREWWIGGDRRREDMAREVEMRGGDLEREIREEGEKEVMVEL